MKGRAAASALGVGIAAVVASGASASAAERDQPVRPPLGNLVGLVRLQAAAYTHRHP